MSDIEPSAVEPLLDAAFGPDRFARTAYRIREGTAAIPALSFALVEDAALVGTIQCWPVAHRTADGTVSPLVMVGPVAVRPDVQRGGHGRALMAHMLAAAEARADAALMMIGDPEYYGRFFGFTADATGAWDLPGPFEKRRLLARAANGHALPMGAGMIGPR
ncbi:putative N-acetyltransferase YhbS [Sphingopyxis panaciterrulae]|uniref:Putative N-acetyltransferase YhbS n=1 Tax=Sphingopyxis panaciterrulae TaxID=462372 RepID=A0A7W9ERH7_9SPHN|nr:N-acetyltransferase [Sphingopyxis panaciterrulae]MBB5707757.1 putative N-acetyltransferase YhbS [Sphingopyxis panaciterrulae]